MDPVGSILAQPESLNQGSDPYLVEGIGYDFIPPVLDRGLVDWWVKTTDADSFQMARRLIAREGLLCGGSSGAAMLATIQAIRHFGLGRGARAAVILPDSVRNYMSRMVSDDWMLIHGFSYLPVSSVQTSLGVVADLPAFPVPLLPTHSTIADLLGTADRSRIWAIQGMAKGELTGQISLSKVLKKLPADLNGLKQMSVIRFANKDVALVHSQMPVSTAMAYLRTDYNVFYFKDDLIVYCIDKAAVIMNMLSS